VFVVGDPARPHLTLFSAVTIPEIAEHMCALGRTDLDVYSSRDGMPVGLAADERQELEAELRRLLQR
jgi:hypothetical protein